MTSRCKQMRLLAICRCQPVHRPGPIARDIISHPFISNFFRFTHNHLSITEGCSCDKMKGGRAIRYYFYEPNSQ